MKAIEIIFLLCFFSFQACGYDSSAESTNTERENDSYNSAISNDRLDENNDDEDKKENIAFGKCGFNDGNHNAIVDYYNPRTGYSKTYTLEVEVEGCKVVQINFPNGGWLDNSHITPEELSEDGNAEIEGEDGKTYTVHIDD